MNSAFKIARNELKLFFVSPIAWAMLIIFLVQMSVFYLTRVTYAIRWEFAGYEPRMTGTIFGHFDALYAQLYTNLMFYVPLLTMGLISRERQNGSIRLLMSSPVTFIEVIVGKYLALLVFLLVLAAGVLGLISLSGALVPDFDYGYALSGLLGFYLLGITYAAVGLFMSSLAKQQLVAAISTIALLAALSFIGTVGQRIPLVDDLAYWLSISGRAEYMKNGLIASKDVLYFLLISVLFLAFTYLKLSAGRRIQPRWVHVGKYAGLAAVVLCFGYVTSMPALTSYADTTRPKSQSLSEGSLAALSGFEGPLDITVLVNALDPHAGYFLPAQRNALYRRLFEKHERMIGKLSVRYQFYYAPSENDRLYEENPGKSDEELAREFAGQNRLDFDEFLSQEDVDAKYGLRAENYRNIYLVDWRDHRSIIRNFDDPSYLPLEPTISAALKRLIAAPKRVAYVTGHGERRIFRAGGEDHRLYISDVRDRSALLNHGFEVEELSLESPVPDRVDILVIAGATESFSPEDLRNLQAYIDAGRDLLVLGEPAGLDAANQLVDGLGVSFMAGELAQPKEEFPEDLIFAPVTDEAVALGFEIPRRREDWPVVLPGAAALRIDETGPFRVTPLLTVTHDMSVSDSEDGSDDMIFSGDDDVTAADALAVAMERSVAGGVQRIVVIGDADLMSTATRSMRDPGRRNNPEFINDMFLYLSHGEYPIDTTRPAPLDTHISIKLNDLGVFRLVLYGVVPGVLLLIGGSVIIRRRRA